MSSASATVSAASASFIGQVPRPSWGISTPLESVIKGAGAIFMGISIKL